MGRGSARVANEAKLEALIETMYLAAQADGELTPPERAHFISSVQSLSERKLTDEKLTALLTQFERSYRESGRERCLLSVKARLGDERSCKAALSMAVRMLVADGTLRTSEREFILEMAETLGIERNAAADLVKELAG